MRRRLDAELVCRGLAQSRNQASELIDSGRVKVNGIVAVKAAAQVNSDTSLVVLDAEQSIQWASRGAYKLLGAVEIFEPAGFSFVDKRCLDAGASTGGFTDVALSRGARQVVAVDVGYGQLIWRLQSDDRVVVIDRTNVRFLDPERIDGFVDVVVSDLSFISLTLVLPALQRCCVQGADLLLMVKPQFEVGKDRVGAGGVVRDMDLRCEAVVNVAQVAGGLGLTMKGVAASPLPGPAGNVEYFLWLNNEGCEVSDHDFTDAHRDMITNVVRLGPR